MIRKLQTLGLILLFALALSPAFSQDSIALPEFKRIDVFGRMEVKINNRQPAGIKIKCDSIHRSSVKFEVKEGSLNIGLLSEFPPEIQILIEVNCPDMQELEIGGGSRVYNRGALLGQTLKINVGLGSELDLLVKIDSVDIKVSKSGFARLSGECRAVKLTTATKGVFRGTDLKNEQLTAKMRGGKAFVSATKSINVDAGMKARFYYLGDPAEFKKEVKSGAVVSQFENNEDDNE